MVTLWPPGCLYTHVVISIELPSAIPAFGSDTERALLKTLENSLFERQRDEALWQLIGLYHGAERLDLSRSVLNLMLAQSEETDRHALCYLALGEIAEAEGNWEKAIENYALGITFTPEDARTRYFLHNNLGCSLNAVGRYTEAEYYCRAAIEIDRTRHNAYKNLGVSLHGRRDLAGAAWAWLEATKVCPADRTAFNLLQRLVEAHPELLTQAPSGRNEF